MKKNSSMQGTLNKLFGKKNSNTNSLYADNPPWMKPQGVKKTSVDYHDEIHNSFSFLDDSGTATLKARPGPRVRPLLQFSNSNTDTQGLAVPTPSVPSQYADNPSIGNGPKLNGNYRMYSSVGDLRLSNYYEYLDEEIPAPPSVPPPPPPTMIPAAPGQDSSPSSTISSPVSPSLPDFIPPTPNASATSMAHFEASTGTSTVPTVSEQRQTDYVSKRKLEGSKDMPMSLPNRFSLNTSAFQNSYGQTTNNINPHSSLPKTKVPPPAPMRTSSMQLHEYQDINLSTEPPPSPVPSSFKPSVQAKLFTAPNKGQISLNDTLNKRKSMLIMEDLQDLSEKDHTIQTNVNTAESSINTNAPHELDIESKTRGGVLSEKTRDFGPGSTVDLQKQFKETNTNDRELPSMISGNFKEESKRPLSSIEFNKMSFGRDGYLSNGYKSKKDDVKIISVKPILRDMPINTNIQPKQSFLANELTDTKAEVVNDGRIDKEEIAELTHPEAPPTPPPMPPPPPPMMTPPKPPVVPPPAPPPPVTVAPQKTPPTTKYVAPPPASPLIPPPASPLLPPKPKTASSTSPVIIPPPPPPKAPPVPPPLPIQTDTSVSQPQLPLLKALQEKQQTLKQIPKKSIEVRPAQVSSIDMTNDDQQKARVDKIKGELEALFSPKKDEKSRDLKISRPNLEVTKKSPITAHKIGGENSIVNSLMMKVPLIPPVSDKEDVDGDASDWMPKSNNTNFQIPEPDYAPITPTKTMNNAGFSDVRSDITRPIMETTLKPAPSLNVPDIVKVEKNDVPTYKPHHERKASAGSLAFDKLSLAVSETPQEDILKKDEEIPYQTNSLKSESPLKQEENIEKHPVTDEQVEANSPMALLLAAKKRAQKSSRAMPLDRSNLPKISVSSGIATSSLTSQYNDVNPNTFVVVPNKENGGQLGHQEVTSFSAKPSNYLGNLSTSSKWTDGEFPSSNVSILGLNSQKPQEEKSSLMYAGENVVRQFSTEERNRDLWKTQSSGTEYHNSPNTSNLMDTYSFNISSVPSPVPVSKTYEDMDYGIIPPPAEFMNSPPMTSMDLHQSNRLYSSNKTKSDFGSDYQWSNESIRPLGSQIMSNDSEFTKYGNDDYSTGISRDSQKGSLIKKRLYMPDPETSGSYSRNANSLRSSALPMSYHHMHTQSSSTMLADSRRSGNPSRYMLQGRRVSSENMNKMLPSMADMKYKSQTTDYGKPISRPQSTYQQGMTFTVRPGTRQPISQMYQGGYL